MKRLLIVISLFLMVVSNTFAQTEFPRALEISDDFAEIKAAFQTRLYAASAKFKYFLHNDGTFYIENEYELFDAKAKEAISNKKYFIFETTDIMTGDIHMYLLILVNKDDAEAVTFIFINDQVKGATPCSKAEIKSALGLYPEL